MIVPAILSVQVGSVLVRERGVIRIFEAYGKGNSNVSSKKDHSNVEVINKDILHWDHPELSPCYFIATEVIVCLALVYSVVVLKSCRITSLTTSSVIERRI